MVEKFLPGDRKSTDPAHPVTSAKNDRLIQLIIKGILYESCVNYCQAKATGSKESEQVTFVFILSLIRLPFLFEILGQILRVIFIFVLEVRRYY